SGLGWLYLLANPPASQALYLAVLARGNDKMYNNLMYIPYNIALWPVPATFAISAFAMSVGMLSRLLRRAEDARGAAALAVLTLSMYLTHPTEGTFFVGYLASLLLFIRDSERL
ncbi:hypothetical protein, partial [Infirmifilum sp.]|uniref:hypothetical protein n=1 Tax=Infirmifilum sp. TaxID=2856575 RepID=UPI003D10FBEB